ncbi:hypothetical protein C1H46_021545 [Malus baccata]|uniref:Retrotransposon gag domain-containing protein n=1 Tax=Malus baccata TaxID=106549 RepID=A0A540M2B3_MALBA|nr:hypothetical protein C1H46_021545 [Malus baccata]
MELKQGKMSVIKYHKKFTDLSRYCPVIAESPREMLRRFKEGTRKRPRSLRASTPCSTYQEFFEILLYVEDSKNGHDDDDDEQENGNTQKNNNKGQSSFDHLIRVQISIHLEWVANQLATYVFRIKGTLTILVLSSITGVILVTTVNVRREIEDVTHVVRRGTSLVNILKIREISFLHYQLQSLHNKNYLLDLMLTNRQLMVVLSTIRVTCPTSERIVA